MKKHEIVCILMQALRKGGLSYENGECRKCIPKGGTEVWAE